MVLVDRDMLQRDGPSLRHWCGKRRCVYDGSWTFRSQAVNVHGNETAYSNFRALERTECRKRVTICNKFKMIFADRKLLQHFIISADFLVVLNTLFNIHLNVVIVKKLIMVHGVPSMPTPQ